MRADVASLPQGLPHGRIKSPVPNPETLQSGQIRIVDGPMARRAYDQLMALETEIRDSWIVYTCPPGHHDDLGISCAMLAWAARHPHLLHWTNTAMSARRPRRPPPPKFSSLGWT